MKPLAGPYSKFLSCYLRNNPATKPQANLIVGSIPFALQGLVSQTLLLHEICRLHSFLHKSKWKNLFFKKNSLSVSAAQHMLCLQFIKIPLDISLYWKPAVELKGFCYGVWVFFFFPNALGFSCKDFTCWKELNSSLPCWICGAMSSNAGHGIWLILLHYWIKAWFCKQRGLLLPISHGTFRDELV